MTQIIIGFPCSAGVGRTGTIILIDACLRMALDEGVLDPFKLLESMRNQRANLVDNVVKSLYCISICFGLLSYFYQSLLRVHSLFLLRHKKLLRLLMSDEWTRIEHKIA